MRHHATARLVAAVLAIGVLLGVAVTDVLTPDAQGTHALQLLPAVHPVRPPAMAPAPDQPGPGNPARRCRQHHPESARQRGEQQSQHQVTRGESLWLIASRRLGHGAGPERIAREVRRLVALNADRLRDGDPNLILVGQVLRLRRPAPGATPIGMVQRALVRLGYRPGPVDGVMGPRTQRAVQQFQKASHLRADGIPGPQTRHALRERFASQQAQRPKQRTSAVQSPPTIPLDVRSPTRSIASGGQHGPPLVQQLPLLLGGLLVVIALGAAIVPTGRARRPERGGS
ncbi:MAG: Peptidoglycan-binding domain 1 protein [Solirubrobacterales bacterium]|jgi:hypothetical protein|nr:Peptidoglycan-binding domain 1 protein [Solirubrobacterales bacterium]